MLVFTSGTTGSPKGIVYDHRHLSHGTWTFAEHCQMDADSVALLKSPYFWAIVEWELFPALTRGGKLVVASPEGHKSPSYLANTIKATEVGVLLITPQVLDLLLDVHEAEPESRLLHQLRHVVAVGEPLGCALANRCVRMLAASLHNFYGASESSCATFTVPPTGMDLALFPNKVPAGLPQPHSRVYVVSGQDHAGRLRRAPAGEAGEVCFGGVLAARYWRQEELTREKWVDDPSLGRLYRTGDLGRWRGGMLEVIGRTDRQVKIRGVRVEPEEVEAVLRKYAGAAPESTSPVLKEVAVVPTNEPAELVAFVSVRAGGPKTISPEDLRAHCRGSLTTAYVPKFFVVLGALPLLPNGKANLQELRRLASRHAAEGEDEIVLDSLGHMKKMSKSALLETAVIHRCYAFWMIGVLSDHFCRCAMDVDAERSIQRFCTSLARQDVRPWTEILIRSLGNDQDMFGFILLGAYQDSRPVGAEGARVDFGLKDLYMFAVYLAAAMPLPQLLKYIFHSDCWPIYWMGDPEPTAVWGSSYMQVTSHVGGHRWYLWMIIMSRLYLAACERCRLPGWLQCVLIAVPALIPVEFAGDICSAIPGEDSAFEYLAAWVFDASAGSCGAYYRWVQWYVCIYVVAFHFIRPITKRLVPILPRGRTWGAIALSLSFFIGLVMAMYHYPNYALEGEKASMWWAFLEIAATIVQPALLVYGMAHVPLNLQWWGNTTLGCYIFHFYFRDQFSVIIMNLSTSLAWDPTGVLLLIMLLGLFVSFTTVMGPLGHYLLVLPKLLATSGGELRSQYRSLLKQVQGWQPVGRQPR
jgi:hypothetical protein